jgi:hypothetical protein
MASKFVPSPCEIFQWTVSFIFIRLYCGFQDAIEVFDVNHPGEGERILTTPTKRSRSGLKGTAGTLPLSSRGMHSECSILFKLGIVSSLAFCPDYSGLYAAGTFSSSLVLFSESSRAEIIQSLDGVLGPVTQVCNSFFL